MYENLDTYVFCVKDLCETLWDICDRRRDDAEKERTRIMQDNWTDDHSGIIVNQSISLMQVRTWCCIELQYLVGIYVLNYSM